MSKFEAAGLVATATVVADEGATALVAPPYFATKARLDGPDSALCDCGVLARPGLVGQGGLLLEHLVQERVERAFDDGRGIAIRDLVGE